MHVSSFHREIITIYGKRPKQSFWIIQYKSFASMRKKNEIYWIGEWWKLLDMQSLMVPYLYNLFMVLYCVTGSAWWVLPQNWDWRYSTTFLSTWKAFLRTSADIAGFDPNTAFAMVITPGFWLLNEAMATAFVVPTLSWKWMRPCGKTKTSPL